MSALRTSLALFIGSLLAASNLTTLNFDLTTPHDSKLGVCKACDCPMRLKVFVPLDKIVGHMLPEAKAALDPTCWILDEERSHACDSAVVDSKDVTK